MSDPFRLLMLTAMYENGGNTTHRFLDGHPEMFVYPFESQIGTRHCTDRLASLFPVKYRWPSFLLDATPEADFMAFIDEETRIRARTPHVSKFRDSAFDFSDEDRGRHYVQHIARLGRSRPHNVEAFFRATFDAWKDFHRTGREKVYVGYSPVIVVDADTMLRDLPGGHMLHVVRNPWSAYADTKKRPVPLSINDYLMAWNLNQSLALLNRERHPGRFHIVRIEDVMADPVAALGPVCRAVGVEVADTLRRVSWNGQPLPTVYPWGTIRTATPEANRRTAGELTAAEQDEVRLQTGVYLDAFDYRRFLDKPA